jgi:DNA-binding response OmpR family regulator
VLEDAGFDVVTAYSGLAAVAAVENNDVCAVVLDVLMPGMSGDAVAQRLRQIDPDLPVLLMTGADEAFAMAAGVPVLRKPFPHEELVAAVRRLVK